MEPQDPQEAATAPGGGSLWLGLSGDIPLLINVEPRDLLIQGCRPETSEEQHSPPPRTGLAYQGEQEWLSLALRQSE